MIHIRHFSVIQQDLATGQIVLVGGAHNPVSVEDTGSGLLMTAKTMNATLVQDAAGKWTISKATLEGNADVVMDSVKAAQARADAAARNHLPVPPPSARTTRTHVLSNHIDYVAGKDETVVSSPAPVDYTDVSEGFATRTENGKSIDIRFSQTTHVTGSAGRLALDVAFGQSGTDAEPRTVHLDGPVNFDLTRTETPLPPTVAVPASVVAAATSAAAPLTLSVVHGVGDRFDADFLTPGDPTLTLTGSVSLNGTGSGYSGTTAANQAEVWLDRATQKPKKYEFQGEPAVSSVNSSRSVGGGGKRP